MNGMAAAMRPFLYPLSCSKQADRFITTKEIEQYAQRLPAFAFKIGVTCQNITRVFARNFEQIAMCFNRSKAETRCAGLAGAEQFSFAAQLQIFLGNSEPVFRFAHYLKTRLTDFSKWAFIE